MKANNNKSFVSKPSIIYFFSVIAICLILIMTVGDKIHGTAYDFSPSDSVAERFRYVWLEFTANLGAVFNLSGLASTVTEYTQSEYSYRYMGMFWMLYYEYFFATRLVGMVVKERTVIDRLLGIVSGCVLQVVLAIILFTYPTEAWKAIVFYLIIFVGLSLLVSIIVVLFMWVGCFFSTPWLLQESWEYASNDDGSVSCRRFVLRILNCYGTPLKFPFIPGFFSGIIVYTLSGVLYTQLIYRLALIWPSRTFLTVVSVLTSFWLNKLGVFVASKLLIDRGKETKMTSVDIYFLIFGLILLLAWFCSTVLGLDLPEFFDSLWMPDSWRSDYEMYWMY